MVLFDIRCPSLTPVYKYLTRVEFNKIYLVPLDDQKYNLVDPFIHVMDTRAIQDNSLAFATSIVIRVHNKPDRPVSQKPFREILLTDEHSHTTCYTDYCRTLLKVV